MTLGDALLARIVAGFEPPLREDVLTAGEFADRVSDMTDMTDTTDVTAVSDRRTRNPPRPVRDALGKP